MEMESMLGSWEAQWREQDEQTRKCNNRGEAEVEAPLYGLWHQRVG